MTTVDDKIARVEKIIGHVFTDKLLCAEALQMGNPLRSVLVGGTICLVDKNQNLALVGDKILDTVLVKMFYKKRDVNGRRRTLREWTNMRNDLCTNASLAARGFSLGLDSCIIKEPGTTAVGLNMMADTFEALLGAVCEDAGEDTISAVRAVIEHLGFTLHPLLSLPDMGDSRKVDKADSKVVRKKGPRSLARDGGGHS